MKYFNKLKNFNNPYDFFSFVNNYLLTKPHRNKFYSTFRRIFTKTKKPDKWVFIIGCYNSGTTLLTKILNENNNISVLDEGVFKTHELLTPEELGWTRLWYKVYDKIKLTDKDKHINIKKLKNDWSIFFDEKKSIYLEKSIVNSARMLWLQENFKNSYFIFIVRNGYAVSEGIRRKSSKGYWGIQKEKYKNKYPIEMCAKQWAFSNEIIERDSKYINNFKKIFYEDLCREPKNTINDILSFIGIENNIDSNIKNLNWEIHEKKSRIVNMNKKSFNNLSKSDIIIIKDIAGDMISYYGY